MYGLNAMAIAAFFGINILAYNLCKCGKKRRKHIMNVLCILLLGGNLLRYGIVYPLILGEIRIPAEFSTVSYFVVPALLLTKRKKGRSWAAYSGLMAGFFYYLALMVMGGKIYGGEMPYEVYISMFCHGTLYICGMVTIGTLACPAKDAGRLIFGVTWICLRALILRERVIGAEEMFIYKLLDGEVIRNFFPQMYWSRMLPVYYIAAVGLVLITMMVFFRSSRRQKQRFDLTRTSQAALAA